MRPPLLLRLLPPVRFLLPLALAIPTPAASQPTSPGLPGIAPEVRERLSKAADDPRLPPWQREFMLRMAEGGPLPTPESRATTAPIEAPDRAPTSADDGSWAGIPPPTMRWLHAAIYDPVRDRMVVFGGQDENASLLLNDVWVLTLTGTPTWSPLVAGGTAPSRRYGQAAVYDPVGDRMVLFGGSDFSVALDDVWALAFTGSPAWSQITPAGSPPAARLLAAAVYDSVRNRMLVFGGSDGGVALGDVWALTLSGGMSWAQLTPSGTPPLPRYDHAAIYDPGRDRMLIYGGVVGGAPNGELWSLTLAGSPAWSQLAPSGSPPAPRILPTAICDRGGDRMVVFGGYSTGGVQFNDAWSINLSGSPAWSLISPTGDLPAVRIGHTAIYDADSARMVVFGGSHLDGSAWALSLSGSPAWAEIAPMDDLPAPRPTPTAIHDPVRDRMLVFGVSGASAVSDDVWALSLSGTPSWSQLATAGSAPPARSDHAAIYDPVRDRMVVFGGYSPSGPRLNDTWALALSGAPTWSELLPAGSPPAGRAWSSAIYDPVRDRMVVFGGSGLTPNLDDVWVLSLSGSPQWEQLTPTGSPPAGRWAHTAVYDPVRDQMVVFGGTGSVRFDDVWALTLSGTPAWNVLTPAGSSPAARYLHTAIYDPVRDRMVVFGGYDGSNYFGDARSLTFSGSPAWSALAPGGASQYARAGHVSIYDPARDRMIVFGGTVSFGGSTVFGRTDAWALEWGQPLAPAASCPGDVIWTPGSTSDLSYGISNPHGFAQRADYTLGSGRGWPGFPITGSVTVAANGSEPVLISVPVPDSAAIGLNPLTFQVTLRGVPQYAFCSHNLHDTTTPVTLSLVSVQADPERVRLTWYAAEAAGLSATVYRRTAEEAWSALERVWANGTRLIVYEDRHVSPGGRYGYRLGVLEEGRERFVGEAWVDVPRMVQFALAGAHPNPAARELVVAFSLPDASPARLEAFDVAGRRIVARDVGSFGRGSHVVRIGEGRALAPGVYALRLTRGNCTITTRAVVVR